MILLLFPYPAIRTGGHKRYLELVRGIHTAGREALLLKHADFDPALPGLTTLDICRGTKPRYLSHSAFFRRSVRAALPLIADLGVLEGIIVFGETLFPAAELLQDSLDIPLIFAFRSNMHMEFKLFGRRSPAGYLKRAVGHLRESRILRAADRIVFQSAFDRDDFQRRFPDLQSEKCAIIPNNVNPSWMPEEYRNSNRSTGLRRLLYIGALNRRKGIPELIEAYALLVGRGRALELDIIGFGELESWLARRIEESGWSDSLRQLGRLENPFPHLQQADLLVVPSLYDSYPNVVMEALHTGTPVIGSRSGGIPDILKHDELLFDAGSAEALADRIEELIEHANFQRARELCLERSKAFEFDWPARFLALLDAGRS